MSNSDLITIDSWIDKANVEAGIDEIYQRWTGLFDMVEERTGLAYKDAAVNVRDYTAAQGASNKVLKDALELNEADARSTYELGLEKQAMKNHIIATTSALGTLKVAIKEQTAAAQESMAVDIAQTGVISEKTKVLITQANTSIAQMRNIEEAVGNYSRNVGRYTDSVHDALNKSAKDFRGLYTSLRSLRGVSYLLGDALGVSVQKVNAFRLGIEHAAQGMAFYKQRQADARKETELLKDSTEVLTAAEIENKETIEALQAAGLTQAEANQVLVISNEEVGYSFMSWLGPLALVAIAVGLVGTAIYKMVEASKEEKKQIEDMTKLEKEENETLKETKELKNQIAVLEGKTTEDNVKYEEVALKAIQQKADAQKIYNDEVRKLQKEREEYAEGGGDAGRTQQDMLDFDRKQSEELAPFTANLHTAIREANDMSEAAYVKKFLKDSIEDTKESIKQMRLLANAEADAMGKGEARDNAKNEAKRKYDELEARNELRGPVNAKKLANELLNIEEIYQEEKEAISEKYNSKSEKAEEKHDAHELEAAEKFYEKALEEWDKYWQKKKTIYDNYNPDPDKENAKFDEQTLKQNVEKAQNLVDLVKNNGAGEQDVKDAEVALENAKYSLLKKQREDAHKAFQADDKNSQQAKIDEDYLFHNQVEIDEGVHQNKLLEIKKKFDDLDKKRDEKDKKQKVKIAKDHSKNIIKKLETELKKYNELRNKNEEEQRKITEENEQAQQKQFDAGRTNSMDALMRKDASQLATLQQQQRTDANEYNAINIFTQLLSGLPHFAEGTPNTGTGGSLEKGGFLSVLHPDETILNAEQKAKVPGLAESIYHGTPENWMLDNYLPKLTIKDDISKDKQIADRIAQVILESNKEVIEAIKNQPFVEYTDRSRKVVANGMTRHINHIDYRTPYPKNPTD